MKIYTELETGSLENGGAVIPPNESNRHYKKALREVEDGLATIDAYAGSTREAAAAAEASKAASKLTGVEFEGVMCSATAEDMWGLSAVQGWIRAGQSTDFKFDNGNTLTLTAANIDAFEAVWIPFRASFF